MAKMQVVFSGMLNEFEWPALEVCSVGIGLLSFSSIVYFSISTSVEIFQK